MIESDQPVSAADAERITAYLDAHAPPPGRSAHVVFGSRQATPAEVVARRYHEGLAPLIILTGGANRRTGEHEASQHRDLLRAHGVAEAAIRCEEESTSTRGNVELARPYLREAIASGLTLTAVCKWYHRRAVQVLRHLLPEVPHFHAVTWDPVYDATVVTRTGWWRGPAGGVRRVLYEWRVIPERIANGTLGEIAFVDGAWR